MSDQPPKPPKPAAPKPPKPAGAAPVKKETVRITLRSQPGEGDGDPPKPAAPAPPKPAGAPPKPGGPPKPAPAPVVIPLKPLSHRPPLKILANILMYLPMHEHATTSQFLCKAINKML